MRGHLQVVQCQPDGAFEVRLAARDRRQGRHAIVLLLRRVGARLAPVAVDRRRRGRRRRRRHGLRRLCLPLHERRRGGGDGGSQSAGRRNFGTEPSGDGGLSGTSGMGLPVPLEPGLARLLTLR